MTPEHKDLIYEDARDTIYNYRMAVFILLSLIAVITVIMYTLSGPLGAFSTWIAFGGILYFIPLELPLTHLTITPRLWWMLLPVKVLVHEPISKSEFKAICGNERMAQIDKRSTVARHDHSLIILKLVM